MVRVKQMVPYSMIEEQYNIKKFSDKEYRRVGKVILNFLRKEWSFRNNTKGNINIILLYQCSGNIIWKYYYSFFCLISQFYDYEKYSFCMRWAWQRFSKMISWKWSQDFGTVTFSLNHQPGYKVILDSGLMQQIVCDWHNNWFASWNPTQLAYDSCHYCFLSLHP